MEKAVMSVRMKKWADIIQEAANSGLSKTEFCSRNGIDRRQFFVWQKRIREFILAQNPELGLPPSQGDLQQIRAMNSQIMPSLPVFCELTPPEPVSDVQTVPAVSFSAGVMIQCGEYQIYVNDSATEKTLSRVLAVIRHA